MMDMEEPAQRLQTIGCERIGNRCAHGNHYFRGSVMRPVREEAATVWTEAR